MQKRPINPHRLFLFLSLLISAVILLTSALSVVARNVPL